MLSFLLPALCLGFAAALGGEPAVGHSEVSDGGRRLVVVSSDLYRLTFDPARGGRCTSFLIRKSGRELVYDGKNAGLFQDHFAHQGWPGELLESAYEHRIESEGERLIAIRLWTVAKGGKDGRDALTKGLRVEKRIVLRAGRRDVDVVNTFANPTAEGKNVGLWVQQCFNYSGDRLFDLYYRPSTHGVHLTGRDDTGQNPYLPVLDVYSADWVGASHYTDAGGREPVAGWTAGRDRRTNEGGVFLLDYDYLDILYNCSGACTTEWFMDKVPLPAGKSWSTRYAFIPVNGFTSFTHASRRLLAGVEVSPEAGRVRIVHQLAGGAAPAGEVTVDTRVYGVRSKQEARLPLLTVADVGLEPVGASQTWDKPQTEPLVIRVDVAGAGWRESYEHLFEGAFGGTGIAGAGEVAEYLVPRPQKRKTFLKPDSWARPDNEHLRVLVLYGLYSNHYRIEAAARVLDPQADIVVSENWNTFPPTHDELLRYDVIVLSNVASGPDYANAMIADVVRFGGVGVLALGGIGTYGAGQWAGTPLGEILPGEIRTNFDLKREAPGVFPKPAGVHAATKGVVFPAAARFYWLNELSPKPGAAVAMTAGKRPLLILGAVGKGRVAAVTGTCHGEAAAGQVEAWLTPAWTKLLAQSLGWLRHAE